MRVLIIEDDNDIRENTTEILELHGYSVHTAHNGKVGIKLMEETNPDVILCDLLMPEVDGYGVYNYAKSNKHTSKIPFIIFSASVEKKEVQKALDMGITAFILKPFDPDELLETLNRCLVKS
jgi:CheY-like chemotaxis protein